MHGRWRAHSVVSRQCQHTMCTIGYIATFKHDLGKLKETCHSPAPMSRLKYVRPYDRPASGMTIVLREKIIMRMRRRSQSAASPESPSLDPRHAEGINADPPSPSLTYAAAASGSPPSPSLTYRPGSPSLYHVVSAPLPPIPHDLSKRSAKSASTTKSCFPRASRMARARNPSSAANDSAYQVVVRRFKEIRSMELERAPKDSQAFRSHKVNLGSGGKGPGVRTCARDQCKMNHLACKLLPS